MDIKLKRYSVLLKALAFVLITCILCFMMLTLIASKEDFIEFEYISNLGAEHYTQTEQYKRIYSDLELAVDDIIRYKSAQSILAGDSVTQSNIDNEIQGLYYKMQYDILNKLRRSGLENISEKMIWDTFQHDFKEEIDGVKDKIIALQLMIFGESVNKIENTPNLYYYIYTDGVTISNKDYESIAEDKYSYYQAVQTPDQKVISQSAFAFDEAYINDENMAFLALKDKITNYIMIVAICLVLMLLCLIYLIFAAGKKAKSPDSVHHVFIDRLFSEITVFLWLSSIAAALFCGYVIIMNHFNRVFMFVLLAASALLSVALLLTLARHIKSRTLLKHTIIFSVLHLLFISLKKVYEAGKPMPKAFIAVALLLMITAIPFAFIVTIPLALYLTYKQVIKYLTVKEGIKRIKSGVYHQKIEINGKGEMAEIAADINDISSGLGTEVERRMKSERLKTDLIVNVSHDIKTPLTSVITYVDLLKKEDIDNENVKEYIDIIAGKSHRLKHLIDDLFDASKASSGNITVNYESVDIGALITQGLGELDDRIKTSTLDFKINMPKEKIIVYADGRLTWRVLENLLSNVFKYSLAYSRVYIGVFEDAENAFVEIKNISNTELNIPEDEILERFKRGDESRSSEGSGLGLDIARSLMRCQNGELSIKIDGDLFKARMRIPKVG